MVGFAGSIVQYYESKRKIEYTTSGSLQGSFVRERLSSQRSDQHTASLNRIRHKIRSRIYASNKHAAVRGDRAKHEGKI